MRAKEARTIPIVDYLHSEGHAPSHFRRGGTEAWYHSPLRAGDSSPSFKVDSSLNLWFDHGLAEGGNVIDLACALHNEAVRDALQRLEQVAGITPSNKFAPKPIAKQTGLFTQTSSQKNSPAGEKEKAGYFEITSVDDINAPALLEYLNVRCIKLDIARKYLKEIHFKPRQHTSDYFALGWPNGDGFEARSKIFKGFVGTQKDITRINLQDGNTLSIFEGFFDFLAFLSHNDNSNFQNSVIILNSASLRKRALREITQHQFSKIYLFLDNDDAGKMTRDFFKRSSGGVKFVDNSYIYEPYKDFNEWIIANKRTS